MPPLNSLADHARAAADIAFGDRPALGAVESLEHVLLTQREALDIAEPAVVRLAHHRQVEELGRPIAHGDGADGVAHEPDLIGVSDADRRAEKTLLGDPRQAGHLAVAIEGVGAGKYGIGPDLALPRPNGGDARPDDLGAILDQGEVADFDATDVGDGIVQAGRQDADPYAELPQPLSHLSASTRFSLVPPI